MELADSGKVRLFVQYRDTNVTLVDDFEGGHTTTSWQTSTIGDSVGDDNSLPVDPAEEQLHVLDTHSPHDTAGVLLRWDGTSDRLWFDVHVHDADSLALLKQRVNPEHLVFGTNFAGWDQQQYDVRAEAAPYTSNARKLLRVG